MSDLAFALFMDRVAAAFAESVVYRRRLLAEAPGYVPRSPRVICPPGHRHGKTSHYYNAHRCGCNGCREASAGRARAARAAAGIRPKNETRSTNT